MLVLSGGAVIVFESRKSRRIVLRLEPGEELVAAIESLAKRSQIRAAWVRGLGSLSSLELDRHDALRREPDPPRRIDGPCDLLALEGNVSLAGGTPIALLHVVVARASGEVLGGRLRSANVFHAELVMECFDDVALTRAHDDATGLAVWIGASDSPEAEEEEEEEERIPAVSWADVAAISAAPVVPQKRAVQKQKPRSDPTPAFRPPPIPDKRRTSEEEYLETVLPERGDWIEHRQFGLCRVDREDDEGGLVIRLPSGIRKTIKLDYMDVGAPRHEGERRVFPVRPRRR
jgi:predicted DNA-binding protein with PD1-like motif